MKNILLLTQTAAFRQLRQVLGAHFRPLLDVLCGFIALEGDVLNVKSWRPVGDFAQNLHINPNNVLSSCIWMPSFGYVSWVHMMPIIFQNELDKTSGSGDGSV